MNVWEEFNDYYLNNLILQVENTYAICKNKEKLGLESTILRYSYYICNNRWNKKEFVLLSVLFNSIYGHFWSSHIFHSLILCLQYLGVIYRQLHKLHVLGIHNTVIRNVLEEIVLKSWIHSCMLLNNEPAVPLETSVQS